MNHDLLTRSATFEPETFDAERNTVHVVFSSGTEVKRRDLSGEYLERLSLDPAAVDLTFLRGAPVLNNHDRYSGVQSVLGVVECASVDGSRGEAVVRFGTRPEVQGIVADVRAGVIRNVSVGYTVEQWQESRDNGARVKTAVRWTPREISFVPLGADPAAQVRTLGGTMKSKNKIACKCRRAISPWRWACRNRRRMRPWRSMTTLKRCEAR